MYTYGKVCVVHKYTFTLPLYNRPIDLLFVLWGMNDDDDDTRCFYWEKAEALMMIAVVCLKYFLSLQPSDMLCSMSFIIILLNVTFLELMEGKVFCKKFFFSAFKKNFQGLPCMYLRIKITHIETKPSHCNRENRATVRWWWCGDHFFVFFLLNFRFVRII